MAAPVVELYTQLLEAWNARSADAFAALFTADASVVGFDGSQIVWQYYPGAGIQIQVLGTFGKVNALWSSRRTAELGAAVDELLPLAAERLRGKKDDGEKAPKAPKPSRGAARKVTTPRKAGGS